jgi:predicted NBD/HSP70 family sugar kinase
MGLRGTNQESGRPYNMRIVLETIRLCGPITRAEIAKSVGLTLQTVSTITGELLRDGLVVLRRPAVKGRGFPAPALEVNPAGGFAVGLHVTPRGLQAALVNLAGEIIAAEAVDLPPGGPEAALDAMERIVTDLTRGRSARVLGAGLAMPGPFDVESMSFVGPTTLEGWRDVPVAERLQARLGFPVSIAMDMAAAAHGERMYGIGAKTRTFYYLYFGVGVGGSMIEDGDVRRGAWGNAGEIGHVPLVPDGEACSCGNRGCLERYVSLEAYERRGNGDPVAFASAVAPILRSAVVVIENLFDPETVVLGGLVPPLLLAAFATELQRLPNSVAARRFRALPRVILSNGGPDTVLRGAAALAVTGALSPRTGLLFSRPESGEGNAGEILEHAGGELA